MQTNQGSRLVWRGNAKAVLCCRPEAKAHTHPVHSFVGASNLAPELSFPNLQQSSCTTATVGADKSNYWVPQLYRKSGNGTLTLMPLSYVNVYYQLRRQPQEPVYEFPPGFRMVSGNPARSTFDASDNRQTAINYNCLNFAGGGGPETNGESDQGKRVERVREDVDSHT